MGSCCDFRKSKIKKFQIHLGITVGGRIERERSQSDVTHCFFYLMRKCFLKKKDNKRCDDEQIYQI
jgi:hypothetical protein